MKIIIEKLNKGCLVEVQDENGETIERASATGKWNLYPILNKHLFESGSAKLKPKAKAKPKNKRKL
jgi:hypothetical protein